MNVIYGWDYCEYITILYDSHGKVKHVFRNNTDAVRFLRANPDAGYVIAKEPIVEGLSE